MYNHTNKLPLHLPLNVSFLEALLGIFLQPRSVTRQLITRPHPPYIFGLILAFVATLFTPIITQAYYYRSLGYSVNVTYSIFLLFVLFALFFTLLELILLRLFAVPVDGEKMVAIFAYALTPVTNVVWLIFLLNFFTNGSLTIVTRVLAGFGELDPRTLFFIPIALGAAQIISLIVFFNAIQELGKMHLFSCLFMAVISFIPLYVSLIMGMVVAEIVFPGTLANIVLITPWPDAALRMLDQLGVQVP
jgi:hypothetical protein